MVFLKFEDIDKSFGENNVISKFNLEVEKGKFIVLLGPSGCGKSTLLRMIAGLEKIDNGKILLENNLLNDLLPSKRQIAMVFQSYALYPHMSVFENISFGLKSEKISKNEIKGKVIEAAKILKIEDLLDRRPKELSGGQRQQVAVGRALMTQPKILMLDEPTAGVSPIVMDELFDRIIEVSRTGIPILMVEQNARQALGIADTGFVMVQGRNAYTGSGKELLADPEVRKSFLGG